MAKENAEESTGLTDEQISQRFEAVEKTQAEQGGTLDKILSIVSGAHQESSQVVKERLEDKPANSVAEEVQRELARRDQATKTEERDARLGKLEEAVKNLTEKPPSAPPRKIESLMGWHG